jgi:hypothetical protein
MAGQIFIEAREVEILGLPSGAMHLYLVFRDTDGAEYVIRSGPKNPYTPWFGDMQVEANVPIGDSSDDRDGDTPAERSSTPLDLPGLTDDQAWALMVKYARLIDAADTPYEVFDENSNAFIGAMFAAAGGDPLAMLPTGVSRGEAVGAVNYRDILADVTPPLDGTVRGTTGADQITGIQVDEVIRAAAGNDTAWGGRGNDQVYGDAGNDLLYGQVGADQIYGGSGADRLYGDSDNDVLSGGTGADLLDGGAGRNTLTGGADADVFRFTQASTTRVRDFEDGVDRIHIEDDVAVRFEDLAITSFGVSGEHTRIVYENIVVELLKVSRAQVDARDLDLIVA